MQFLHSSQNIHFKLTLEQILELLWQNMLHLGCFGCYLEFVLASDPIVLIFVLSV